MSKLHPLGKTYRHHLADQQYAIKRSAKILKHGKAMEGYAILEKLGIEPRDIETVKLVNNQLESLRRFGLVEEDANGWRWIK